jgi:hypothetical protein
LLAAVVASSKFILFIYLVLKDFLESIGIKDVPFEKIRRWHQKFDLENLKEIEEAELPKPPIDESIKCKTGQELLNIAKDIYSSRVSWAGFKAGFVSHVVAYLL